MNRSESIGKLSAALVKAQSEMKPIAFDATNPFLKNRYASLGAVIEGTRPILAANGLAITQFPVNSINQIGIVTILIHTSGEYIESTVTLNLSDEKGKSLAQVAGSVITYLRRYSWVSILGLYADEDTDGTMVAIKEAVQSAVEQEDSVWTQKQIDVVMEILPNLAPDTEQAQTILDLSVLPITATVKTVKSWLGYVKQQSDAGKPLFDAAEVANAAYKKAVEK